MTIAGHGEAGRIDERRDGRPRWSTGAVAERGRHRRARPPRAARGRRPSRIAIALRSRGHLSALRLGTLQLGTLRLEADARVDARDEAPPGTRSLSSRGKVDVMGLSVGRTRVRTGNLRFDLRGTLDAPSGGLTMSARDVVLAPDAPKIDSIALDAKGSRGGTLTVRAAVSGPRLRGGLRAHGSATAAAADVTLDGLSLDVTTTAYRQKLDLERPAQIRYRAGDELAVEHLALRGAGARFTGEAVLDAAYRLPPARRDPLARLRARAPARIRRRPAAHGCAAPGDAGPAPRDGATRRHHAVRRGAAPPRCGCARRGGARRCAHAGNPRQRRRPPQEQQGAAASHPVRRAPARAPGDHGRHRVPRSRR